MTVRATPISRISAEVSEIQLYAKGDSNATMATTSSISKMLAPRWLSSGRASLDFENNSWLSAVTFSLDHAFFYIYAFFQTLPENILADNILRQRLGIKGAAQAGYNRPTVHRFAVIVGRVQNDGYFVVA
jgi:hypothetical protein